MIISLTPSQFKQLNKLIEASRRGISEVDEGELSLSENCNTDSIEWSEQEVRITIKD